MPGTGSSARAQGHQGTPHCSLCPWPGTECQGDCLDQHSGLRPLHAQPGGHSGPRGMLLMPRLEAECQCVCVWQRWHTRPSMSLPALALLLLPCQLPSLRVPFRARSILPALAGPLRAQPHGVAFPEAQRGHTQHQQRLCGHWGHTSSATRSQRGSENHRVCQAGRDPPRSSSAAPGPAQTPQQPRAVPQSVGQTLPEHRAPQPRGNRMDG